MTQAIEAIYVGTVFHPTSTLILERNTRVSLFVEVMPDERAESLSFLQIARSLNLTGPPDWSANLESYLYGR